MTADSSKSHASHIAAKIEAENFGEKRYFQHWIADWSRNINHLQLVLQSQYGKKNST
jgi:hypothetical protein